MLKNKILLAVTAVVVLGAAAGGWYYYGQSKKTAAVPTQTFSATMGTAESIVSATGTIKPLNFVEISSKITARIKAIPVKENDIVKAGQTLAILEDKELDTRLEQAQYKVTNSRSKYNRISSLHDIGAKSDQDLEDSLLEYQTAMTSLQGVQSNVDDTIIVAPMDGVVVGEPKSVGTMVAQGVNNPTVIMLLADMSKKQIDAKIDETDIGKIKLGQKATFTVDAYTDKKFTATVAKISQTDTGNTWSSTSSTNATVIYYSVTLDVDDPDNLLKPAMTARVDILTDKKDGAVMIPLAALKTNAQEQYVVRLNSDGTTENVPVKVGLYSGDKVEIVSGLSDGDKVVASYTKKAASGTSGQHRNGAPM